MVRRTGGLADTVTEHGETRGNGFLFDAARPDAMLGALRRAEEVRAQAGAWHELQRRGMRCRFGWEDAAARYEDMYEAALGDQPR